ncbi:protein phosphatase 1 regulatory subunit 16A [Schistocerca nitens]|uniref:protein phosphatase 1 regulatory subunit 16A n=1 Tax=Schistocerca nitens TaxID=7011 RepID=UPI00211810EB|nr:protein phosphatase 1 regulatory subunit 16A [Schistocerca nitens]
MEHADLVAEMAHVEHLSTQERLHLARRRRLQQLKLWSQREKEWMRHRGNSREISKSSKRHIYFSDSVMLLEAAARNDIDEVRRLLMKGVSPDSTNEDGLTALHQCCIDDNEEMMKLLIEYGANVNAEDSEKWTPLHAAATCGHLHLVRYLISRGANLLAVNADGNMPYDICEDEAALDYIESEMARRGVTQELIDETRASTETQMLQDLQEAVALDLDIEAADQQGATPLHIAAANGYLRVVEYLLDQHVSTEVRDNDGWQPVHAAACWGHLEVLEMLVQNGADLNAKTHHDETPADICEDPELRERILQLRTEQETKRMQEAKKGRVKRSQSNTRTQSVRRTSIRDKVLTTKKDTVEEARLRLQAREVFAPQPDDGDSRAASDVSTENFVNGNVARPGQEVVPNAARHAPDGKDDSSGMAAVVEAQDVKGPPSALEIPAETSYVTEGNGKININVTVTINAGTLADLKKQRAQIRNSSPTEVTGGSAPLLLSPASVTGSDMLLTDSSASPPVRRFTGNTSEIVGDPRTRRCCIIS